MQNQLGNRAVAGFFRGRARQNLGQQIFFGCTSVSVITEHWSADDAVSNPHKRKLMTTSLPLEARWQQWYGGIQANTEIDCQGV